MDTFLYAVLEDRHLHLPTRINQKACFQRLTSLHLDGLKDLLHQATQHQNAVHHHTIDPLHLVTVSILGISIILLESLLGFRSQLAKSKVD